MGCQQSLLDRVFIGGDISINKEIFNQSFDELDSDQDGVLNASETLHLLKGLLEHVPSSSFQTADLLIPHQLKPEAVRDALSQEMQRVTEAFNQPKYLDQLVTEFHEMIRNRRQQEEQGQLTDSYDSHDNDDSHDSHDSQVHEFNRNKNEKDHNTADAKSVAHTNNDHSDQNHEQNYHHNKSSSGVVVGLNVLEFRAHFQDYAMSLFWRLQQLALERFQAKNDTIQGVEEISLRLPKKEKKKF